MRLPLSTGQCCGFPAGAPPQPEPVELHARPRRPRCPRLGRRLLGLAWAGRTLALAAADFQVIDDVASPSGTSPPGLLGVLEAHSGPIYALALAQDGWLATGATDKSVVVWNTTLRSADGLLSSRRRPFRRLQGHLAGVTAMAFARLGPETDGRPTEALQDGIPEDREVLISGGADNATRIWDVRSSRLLSTQTHPRTVFGVAARHSGGEFATACWDGTVRIFGLPLGSLKAELPGHTGGLYSVAYSPLDGSLLASASADHTVRVWDAGKMELLWTLRSHKDHVTTVDWSPSSKYMLASAGWDRKFRLWAFSDQEAEACRRNSICSTNVAPRWTGRHPQLIWRAAFAPFGDLVAACHGAVGQSPTVVIYEASTGNVVRRLGRHKDTPLAIAWSPDGSLLASAGMDRKVLVYDAFAAQDDMPQGDLDDSEEKQQWMEDLARYRQEGKSGIPTAAMQQNSSENGTAQPGRLVTGAASPPPRQNATGPELKILHPLAGRPAFF